MVKAIHSNMLKPSSMDMVELCKAVSERFFTLKKRYEKKWGIVFVHPPELEGDFKRWERLINRYKRGDYQHTDSEKSSLRAIAQWTVDENCKVCGQPETRLTWKD